VSKRIIIPLGAFLIAVIVLVTVLYTQKSSDLNSTKDDLKASQSEVTRLTNDLSSSQAKVTSLDTDLKASQAQVKTTQASLKAQQDASQALTTELKTVKSPRHFATLQEFTDWVRADDTNIVYANITAEERSYILQVRAIRDGYLFPVNFTDVDNDYDLELCLESGIDR
jgi:septal ring factor EnvC (AmiA/AmiB activator)